VVINSIGHDHAFEYKAEHLLLGEGGGVIHVRIDGGVYLEGAM
jgi:hypothetical protein